MSEWLPIGTAPRDCPLLLTDGAALGLGFWCIVKPWEPKGGHWADYPAASRGASLVGIGFTPTHWLKPPALMAHEDAA
jgi:hypothetical protein